MTVYSKVGLHGAGPGVGDFMRALDSAGIPFRIKSIANGGYAMEAAQLAQASGLPHDIILRWPEPNGRGDDHPILGGDPIDSARELYYGWLEPQIAKTPEIHPFKNYIRIEPTNEISTNDNDPSWVGYCLLELAKLLNADGWPAALGGFNNGQPNKQDWKTPGMRALLEYVAANRQNTITVHEGKTTVDDMYQDPMNLWPFLIGRFTYILEACSDMGIPHPRIEISEWGWKYDDMPDQGKALEDVKWLAKTLAQYPTVEAAYLWNLERGSQWGSLPNKMAGFIPVLQAYNLGTTFPDPDPQPQPDPSPEPSPEPVVDYIVVVNLLPQDVTDDEYNQVRAATKANKETILQSAHDAARLVAPGKAGSKVKVWWPERWQDDIVTWLIVMGVVMVEILPAGAIPDLGLTVPISGQYVIKDSYKFDAYRNYSWLPGYKQAHEGLDFAPAEGNTTSKCLATKDGEVYFVGYNDGGYGHYVKIKHTWPITFYTYQAHMAERPSVTVGQKVKQGQVIGLVGSTGFSSGPHCHLTVQVIPEGKDGYVVPDVINPWDHMIWDVMPDPTTPAPPPPSGGTTLIGLHATADPRLAQGELGIFETARIELVKVLSNIDPNDLRALKDRINPQDWIIRAYLSMNEGGAPRLRTPQQFVNDTVADVRRSIQTIGHEELWIELHNEPNLVPEGLGGSWKDGWTFDAWYREVLRLYRLQFPRAKFMFPGLSPGPAIPGLRDEKYAFLEACRLSLEASDSIGDHVYWGVGETVYTALANVDHMIGWLRYRGLTQPPIYITEASDKGGGTGSAKGQAYVTFYNGLKNRAQTAGVTYFVASASHPDFQNEVWVKGGSSVGIAEEVAKR